MRRNKYISDTGMEPVPEIKRSARMRTRANRNQSLSASPVRGVQDSQATLDFGLRSGDVLWSVPSFYLYNSFFMNQLF